MHVTAKDKGTGKENTIKIQEGSGLSKEEIDRMIKDAEAHAEEDRKRREEADVRNQAESLVYQTEKFVKEQREAEGGSKVPEDTLNKVDAAVAEAKTALEGTDIAAIKSAMEKLGQESQALGQAIYEATQAERRQAGGRRLPAARPARLTMSWTRRWSTTTGSPSDATEQSARTGDRHRQAADRSRDRRSTAGALPARRRRGAEPAGAGGAGSEARPTRSPSCTADLQRVQAEFANYRKRALRDQQAAADRAKAAVVSQLLGVLDDLDRARKHGDLESGPLKSVADKLASALTGLGLTAFGAEGEDFDPALHEAVQHEGDGDGLQAGDRHGHAAGLQAGRPGAAPRAGRRRRHGRRRRARPATARPTRGQNRAADSDDDGAQQSAESSTKTHEKVKEVTRHGPA